MADLLTLQRDLDALKASRRSGVMRVRFGDREVFYKADSQMRDAIASIENEIAALDGSPVVCSINIRSRGWS